MSSAYNWPRQPKPLISPWLPVSPADEAEDGVSSSIGETSLPSLCPGGFQVETSAERVWEAGVLESALHAGQDIKLLKTFYLEVNVDFKALVKNTSGWLCDNVKG